MFLGFMDLLHIIVILVVLLIDLALNAGYILIIDFANLVLTTMLLLLFGSRQSRWILDT